MSTVGALLRRPDDGSRPEFIVVNPAFDYTRSPRRACRRRGGARLASRTISSSRSTASARRSRPRTRLVFVTSPNNPTGVPCAQRRDPERRAGRSAGWRDHLRRRGLPRLLRRHGAAARRLVPERRRRPHVLPRRTVWPALRVGALIGRPGHDGSDARGDAALQPQRRCGRRAAGGDGATASACAWYVRPGVNRSRGSSSTSSARARPHVLGQRRQLRARARRRPGWLALVSRRWPREASTSAIESAEPGCAGCIRITTGIVEHTRRLPRCHGGGCCAPRGDRSQDDARREVRVGADARGTRPLRRCRPASGSSTTCWSSFARHGAFDLR